MRLRHCVAAASFGLILALGAWGCGGEDPVAAASKNVTVAPSATSYEDALKAEQEQQKKQAEFDKQLAKKKN
jgi:hypothetical protein